MKWPKSSPIQILPRTDWAQQQPTYRDAEPAIIEAA
ncbi:MAG: 2Fe-2S ferredoxin, partial [Mycobacterium sp.]